MTGEAVDDVVNNEYQLRDFCDSEGCSVYGELQQCEAGSGLYAELEKKCRTSCKYTQTQLLVWLMSNADLVEREQDVERVCYAQTAWAFDEWMQGIGMRFVKR
jgi:hypothetical protein